MHRTRSLLFAAGLLWGVVGSTVENLAVADEIWDLMNPAWWMGLDDDDGWHHRHHRWGRYAWDGPWGPNWGGGPWGVYGWGYPLGLGPPLVASQQADDTPPEPRLPE